MIRPRILERAADKCEQCQVPNRALVVRNHRDFPGWWFEVQGGQAHDNSGKTHGFVRGSDMPVDDGRGARFVLIVLTIAHLDHIPGHDEDDNLKALCQWCHLRHDQAEHTANARETRMDRKDAARLLLQRMIA